MKKKIGGFLLVVALMVSLGLVPVSAVGANSVPVIKGLWHFDELSAATTVADSSGNNNTGTVYGAATGETGKFGNALSFDGTAAYVDCGTGITITTAITVEAWIKPDAFTDYDAIVTNFAWPTNPEGFSFRVMANGKLMWRAVLSGDNYYYITSDATLETGNWYHVAVTHESSYTRLYINGTLDNEENPGGTIVNLGKALKIGWDDYAIHRVFNGLIDEVRIWDGALTPEEIVLSYSGRVNWLPPVTNADFILQDGTTLPLKFQLYQDGSSLTNQQPVFLLVTRPDGSATTYQLGDGVDNLRWNTDGFYYIANLKTKDGTWPSGAYTAFVGDVSPAIGFTLSLEKGMGRGNSGK